VGQVEKSEEMIDLYSTILIAIINVNALNSKRQTLSGCR
jgi:hypothetical protein